MWVGQDRIEVMLAQKSGKRDPIFTWHGHIEDNDIDVGFTECISDGVPTVGRVNGVAPKVGFIIDDQYRGPCRRRGGRDVFSF